MMAHTRPIERTAGATGCPGRPGPTAKSAVLSAGLLMLLCGCGSTSFLITPVPVSRALDEWVIIRESAWATRKIAVVDVDGVLKNARSRTLTGAVGENPVSLLKEKLDRAARDQRVAAVVVRINSPGGSVTASDLMHEELRRFRQQTGKPVVASLLDVGASGAYYVACAADQIYGHPTTVTGSIGVVMLAPELTGTMQLLGVRMHTFKSGAMKDAGSLFREMSDEDRAMFAGLVDQMYARFLTVVRTGRPGVPEERLRALADGRVFLAPEAKDLGLIDEVGTLEDAILAAKAAAGLADRKVLVVQYARPLEHRPNYYARTAGTETGRDAWIDQPPQINLVNLVLPEWLSSPSPQLMYLWAPGW